MLGSSWVAAQSAASPEGLSSMREYRIQCSPLFHSINKSWVYINYLIRAPKSSFFLTLWDINDSFSTETMERRTVGWVMDDELERIWKEEIVALSRYFADIFLGGTEGNNEKRLGASAERTDHLLITNMQSYLYDQPELWSCCRKALQNKRSLIPTQFKLRKNILLFFFIVIVFKRSLLI
jgi:hypothetical protein